ncbi:hypothetical protein EVAR_18368_1 [Eumeta japonica]|uniref:Uncharacterized protein n=1 Tax=Eumeta variegata TaxID=151549 RepID=A0A4C1UUB1_EUMVA|nr:hypothetical protein EVAR_18368_1 [Eumeta japonica]
MGQLDRSLLPSQTAKLNNCPNMTDPRYKRSFFKKIGIFLYVTEHKQRRAHLMEPQNGHIINASFASSDNSRNFYPRNTASSSDLRDKDTLWHSYFDHLFRIYKTDEKGSFYYCQEPKTWGSRVARKKIQRWLIARGVVLAPHPVSNHVEGLLLARF